MEAKNFLLLTASIGAGHSRAAQAISEALALKFPAASVIVADCTERHISLACWLMKKIYLKMLDFLPNLYDVFYRLAGGNSGGTLARILFSLMIYPAVSRLIKIYRPDFIVSTHPFPAGATALAKKLGNRRVKMAVVLTDYSVHRAWWYRETDLYFTATEEMRNRLTDWGFSAQLVYANGIPVVASVVNAPIKAIARQQLGIETTSPVLLMMGGGLGLGSMSKAITELERTELPLTILVVTGKNLNLRRRLTEQIATSRHRVLIWGYTDKIPLLMAAADLLMTKPGALTMSEAFVLGLPLLLTEPIPGPEALNARFAVENGAAIWLTDKDKLSEVVMRILTDEIKINSMRQAALSIAKPHAASQIVTAILRFCS